SMALKAGSRDQIVSLGNQLLASQPRLDAIMADMAEQLGRPVADIKASIQTMVASAGPIKTPAALTDLQRQFLSFQSYVSTHLKTGNAGNSRLAKLGDLGAAFREAFPDVSKALRTSVIDANKVMAARAQDIYAYTQKMSATDAARLLEALHGVPTQTAVAMTAAQQTVAGATGNNAPAPNVTVESGAMQVTITGNADAVTVAQLQQVLTDFQDQLVQEVVGSR
ncbi:MAG: hypothetical protein JWR85_4083, partial [Marmoricola sp.]|nr:hypothetical protein [Marmoricola sp.]